MASPISFSPTVKQQSNKCTFMINRERIKFRAIFTTPYPIYTYTCVFVFIHYMYYIYNICPAIYSYPFLRKSLSLSFYILYYPHCDNISNHPSKMSPNLRISLSPLKLYACVRNNIGPHLPLFKES